MARIKEADFYYGSVLSMLFNKEINPALVESSNDRQVYDITVDKNDFRLFIKYRSDKNQTKTVDYYSWTFILTPKDISELHNYIQQGHNLVLSLVCGVKNLSESEIALLNKDEIIEILKLQKSSITISRRKNEHSYRIATTGSRKSAIQIKANRFEELIGT